MPGARLNPRFPSPAGQHAGLFWTADGRSIAGTPTRTFLGSGDWYVEDRLAGDTGDGSLSDLTPQNVSVTGGALQFQCRQETTTRGLANGRTHTSGEIQLSTLAFTGGTIEARIWFGPTGGCSAALWLLGQNCQQTLKTTEDNTGSCSWPNPGSAEIDLAEMLVNDTNLVNCQIHTASSQAANKYSAGVDVTLGYHIYKTIWIPGVSVESFFDGVSKGKITDSAVPNEPMFLIFDYWAGNAGNAVTALMPANTLLDYVRVT